MVLCPYFCLSVPALAYSSRPTAAGLLLWAQWAGDIDQFLLQCLQCFDAVGWVAGRASDLYQTEWWGAGVVICLERGADLHMAQLMPLPLTVSCFSKIQIGFTFLYRLTWVVPEKWPLKGCMCVCIPATAAGECGHCHLVRICR